MRTERVKSMKLSLFRAIGLTPCYYSLDEKVKVFDPFVINNAHIFLTLKDLFFSQNCDSFNKMSLY